MVRYAWSQSTSHGLQSGRVVVGSQGMQFLLDLVLQEVVNTGRFRNANGSGPM